MPTPSRGHGTRRAHHLAVEGRVSASTQNQAFSALLFLDQKGAIAEIEYCDIWKRLEVEQSSAKM